jgi:hypothetical protein
MMMTATEMLPNHLLRAGWACGWSYAQLTSGLAGIDQTKTVALVPGEANPGLASPAFHIAQTTPARASFHAMVRRIEQDVMSCGAFKQHQFTTRAGDEKIHDFARV